MLQQDDDIRALLRASKTIAVVGYSKNTARPSHVIAAYLQANGYRIIPINPACAGEHLIGEHCYATLKQAGAMLSEEGVPIDIVVCFRRPTASADVIEQAIDIHAPGVWLAPGASPAGGWPSKSNALLAIVAERCIRAEHQRLIQRLSGN